MRKFAVILCVALLASTAVHAAVVETHSVRSPGHFDAAAYAQQRGVTLSWLMAEQVAAGLSRPMTIALSEQELLDIESGDCESCTADRALRVGMVKPVGASIDLRRPLYGSVERTDDGGFVWTAAATSSYAYGVRLHFSDFALPEGCELYIYSERGEVFGPYVDRGPLGSGDFWANTVAGHQVILQLRYHGADSEQARAAVRFQVADLGHLGSRFYVSNESQPAKSFCSFNEPCVENASCFNVSAVAEAKYAIAHMQYVKRPYIYFCSGGLLNNTNDDFTPYFLTANHCISRDREAGTLEAFFQFWTSCSSPECPNYNQVDTPRTLGASVLSTNKTSDYTLLQLAQPAPAGSAFMGWNKQAVAFSDGTALYRVSHPGGAPQAYSKHEVDVNKGTCLSWPRGEWIYSTDLTGATEGGSSGSPVVNGSGQVVGQLSGGCGTNVNDVCDSVSNATVDGALAAYFTQVEPWLDPSGCPDGDGDGYPSDACGGSDCDDTDPNINPGEAEVCDGVDNNCDGFTDEGCSGCTDNDNDGYCAEVDDCDDSNPDVNPGMPELCDGIDNNCDFVVDEGCGCLPQGDPCTAGAECCSGLCHPKKLTCK